MDSILWLNELLYNPVFLVTALVFGGMVVGFTGYKLFRFYSAAIGFVVGVILGYYLSNFMFNEPLTLAYFVAGVVMAIAFGLFYRAGLFLTGVVVGYMFLSSLLPEKQLYCYVFAVLCGILVLFLERIMLILITAFLGATAVTAAVEILVSGITGYDFLLDPRNVFSATFSSPSLFLLWFVLGLIGLITQLAISREESEE
jgi:hypothetical protein